MALRNLASVAVATSTGATTLATIYMFARQNVRYSDFIVGSLAWNPQSKLQDFLALPMAAIFAALSFVVASRLIDHARSLPRSDQAENQLEVHLIWWSLPTIIATAGLALNPVVDQNAIQLSVAALGGIGTLATVTLLASCWLQIRRFGDARPESTSLILLGSALCGLAPIALTTSLGRVGLVLTPQPSALIPAVVAVTITGLVAAVWIIDISISRSRVTAAIPMLLAIAQLPLALFYTVLWPSTPILPGGEQLPYSTTFWLVALVGGLVAVALFGASRQLVATIRGRHFNGSPWHRASLALFAPVIYLKWGTSVVPSISPDDFHFGELLLGWWSLTNGYIPYVDYMPPHGIVDDYLGQAFAFIFFDGYASSIGEASRIATACMAILIYLALCRLTGSLGIAMVGSIFLAANGGRFLWAPLLMVVAVLLEASVISRRILWLTICPLLAIAVILLTPTYGIALGLALSLPCAYLLYRLLREHQFRLLTYIAGACTLMGIVIAVSPIGRMLTGEVKYLAENAPINTTAYGIAWSESWNYSVPSGLVFEIARMQWATGLFIALVLAVVAVSNRKRNGQLIAVSVGSAIFLIALVPYVMGRIDPGAISRPGLISIVVWTSIIPILVSRYKPKVPSAAIVLVMVVACGSITSQTFPLATLKTAMLPIYSIGAVQDGASIGMPQMGRGVVDTTWWEGKTRLAREFATLEQDKGTYLDLSNRNANYFYLQRLPPTPVTSFYTMVPRSTQTEVVAYLQNNPDTFILVEDNNILHDAAPLSLRAPLVYRSILDNYVPQVANGMVFAFRRAEYRQPEFQIISDGNKNSAPTNRLRIDVSRSLLTPEPGSRLFIGGDVFEVVTSQPDGTITIKPHILKGMPSVAIARLNDSQRRAYALALWQRIFGVSDVRGIAGAWGSSAKSLLALIPNVIELGQSTRTLHDLRETNGHLITIGKDPGATYLLTTPLASARSTPYLTLNFSCVGKHETPQLQVYWWSSNASALETASMFFNAPDGTLVVPLDSNPTWRLANQIVGIRVDLANPSACDAISLDKIELRG